MYNAYNPYNNQMYMQDLQNMRDRIDRQMQIVNQNQPQAQTPQINQNFQITPTQNNNEMQAKYVNDIDDVKNTFVMNIGLFINKQMSNLWIKDVRGDIKTFKLEEVIEKDEKDIEIENLKQELEKMKDMISKTTTTSKKETLEKK